MRKLRREEEERKEVRREKQKRWRENYIQTKITENLTKTNDKEIQE